MLADDSYMFRWAEYEFEDEMYCQKSDKIIFTDLKGNNSVNEFYSIFGELGLEEYGQTILPCLPCASCHAVSTDRLWVLNQYQEQQLYIFSQQGDVILERDVQGKQMFYEPIITDEPLKQANIKTDRLSEKSKRLNFHTENTSKIWK